MIFVMSHMYRCMTQAKLAVVGFINVNSLTSKININVFKNNVCYTEMYEHENLDSIDLHAYCQ